MMNLKWVLRGVFFSITFIVGVAGANTITLNPTDDVMVWSAYPDRNFNQTYDSTDQALIAGYSYIGPHYENFLLKFNLSAVPNYAVITSASLFLYGRASSDEHTFLYSMTQDGWDEDTVTWNSFPYMSGVQIADTDVYVPYSTKQWFEWEINVSAWDWLTDLSDNAVTFLMKGDSSDMNYTVSAILSSKEYRDVGGIAYLPYLDITYTIPEPATIVLLVIGGLWGFRRK